VGAVVWFEIGGFTFEWPGRKITTFSQWNSFCITFDRNNSNLVLIINGKNAKLTSKNQNLIQNITFSENPLPNITVGYYAGLLTDMNVW
jgi:hypothetical protein